MDQFVEYAPAQVGADLCLRCDQQLMPYSGTAHPVTVYKSDLAKFIAENLKRWDRVAQRLYIASQKEILKLETKHLNKAWRTNRHELISVYNNQQSRDRTKQNQNGVVPFLQVEAALQDKQQHLADQRRCLDDLCSLLQIDYAKPLTPNIDSPEFVVDTPPVNPFRDGYKMDLLLGSPETSYQLQIPPLHLADGPRPAAPRSLRPNPLPQPLIQFDEQNDSNVINTSQHNGITSSGISQCPLPVAPQDYRTTCSAYDHVNPAHPIVRPNTQSPKFNNEEFPIQTPEYPMRRSRATNQNSIRREWESFTTDGDSTVNEGGIESFTPITGLGRLISLATDVDDDGDDAKTNVPQGSSGVPVPRSSTLYDLTEVDRLQELADSNTRANNELVNTPKASNTATELSLFHIPPPDIMTATIKNTRITDQTSKISKHTRRPLPFVPNEDLVDKIFKTEQDRIAAMRNNRESYGRVSPIFRYGVQYCPNILTSEIQPEHQDVDYQCRNVVISGLPVGVEVRDISARVRGGLIIRITIVDTTSVNNGVSALVSFANWRYAHAYANYVANNPISICGRQVGASLAHKPSYPLPRVTELSLSQNATRCLAIENYPLDRYAQLFRHMSGCFHNLEGVLEDVFADDNETIHMSFQSIEFASRFYSLIQHYEQYTSVRDGLRFSQDPCNAPLETLQLPVRLARGEFPSLLDAWVQSKQCQDQIEGAIPRDHQPIAPDDTLDITSIDTINAVERRKVRIRSLALGDAPVNSDPSALGQVVKCSESSHPNKCYLVTTKDGRARPEPAQRAVDMKMFRPYGDEWIGYKAYTLREYNEKYGYKEYIEDPDQWKTKFPYVGRLKWFEPFEKRRPLFRDEKIPKQQHLSRDNGKFQALMDRDDLPYVWKSDVDAIALSSGIVGVPLEDALAGYHGVHTHTKRNEAYRGGEEPQEEKYPADGMKWLQLPFLSRAVQWPDPDSGPDWKEDFYKTLEEWRSKSSSDALSELSANSSSTRAVDQSSRPLAGP